MYVFLNRKCETKTLKHGNLKSIEINSAIEWTLYSISKINRHRFWKNIYVGNVLFYISNQSLYVLYSTAVREYFAEKRGK